MPGVRKRFFPAARAALMSSTASPGLAMRKSDIGRSVPGAWPVAQVMPVVPAWRLGTKTK